MKAILEYIETLTNIDFSAATEMSFRSPFENFINDFVAENKLEKYTVLHEGKRIGKFGVPDFRISINASIIGYIETKNIAEIGRAHV